MYRVVLYCISSQLFLSKMKSVDLAKLADLLVDLPVGRPFSLFTEERILAYRSKMADLARAACRYTVKHLT